MNKDDYFFSHSHTEIKLPKDRTREATFNIKIDKTITAEKARQIMKEIIEKRRDL
jgi:hypothetical protein